MDDQNAGRRVIAQRAYEWFLKKSTDEAMRNAPRDADIQSERALTVEMDIARLWSDQETREDILVMYAQQKPEEQQAELAGLREKYGIRSKQ